MDAGQDGSIRWEPHKRNSRQRYVRPCRRSGQSPEMAGATASRMRRVPLDPPQRDPPAPSASTGADRSPALRQRERNSPVKNRMRETCTSGSVRGGDGNIPTYSAFGAAQRREGGVESALVGKGREVAEKGEPARCTQRCEPFEKEAAEQAREDAHRQEEAGLAGD